MNPIVCLIPCCSSKDASGKIIEPNTALSKNELPSKWHFLEKARQRIREMADGSADNISFDQDSAFTSALYLYTGTFYRELNLRFLIDGIQANKLRLFILSAGYGVVDAFEPLQYYDAEMKGKVARHWKAFDLEGIVCELLLTLEPRCVFGFFAGSDSWSGPGAKYRYFFVEGLNRALNEGLDVGLSGCFFRSSGRGTSQILGSLGRTFMDFVGSGFSESFISDVALNSRQYGTTIVSFKSQSSFVKKYGKVRTILQ